ncbi:class I SAM-dependent methyltransferase [Aureisphaera galaxeae]|uniref:class I SAM-dependent methyltransferase n=1 Tax=Aureisphaera galaxeae TaxID=1538023 RepID=UPI00235025EC|nr:class I SAM-dependent methyltransferase [Aureisphaera galaxeae]MDC8003435.1 class I SAM-dependent methyltransferase [Aureisphaera galaxeae]
MDYNNKPDGYFDTIRQEMVRYLPSEARKIMDIGCGTGSFALHLKETFGVEAWGIEYVNEHAQEASKVLDRAFSGPCEDFLDMLPNDYFDAIFFNDVLEHMVDPYEVLQKIKPKLSPNGVIISSIPNIRSYDTFMKLALKKDWRYEKNGILDHTHLRFFTGKSIRRMYEDLGYEIMLHEGINKTKSLRPILFNMFVFFTQMDMRNLQYATVARAKPS